MTYVGVVVQCHAFLSRICDYFHVSVTKIQGDPCNQWTEGWVGPIALQDALEKKETFASIDHGY
jgi:hypothetical protein